MVSGLRLRKSRDFLSANEWSLVLIVAGLFVLGVLYATNTLYSGHLSKVDFTTSFGNENSWSSWSTNNFGSPVGLNKSVILYLDVASIIPSFPFKDVIFFYIGPIFLVGKGIFTYVDGHLKQRGVTESNLVAAYTVLLFFTSVVFLSVFLYGWNLITLLPIAGLVFACHGIDVFYKSKNLSGLLYIAFGGFLIGGMVHFFLIPIIYAIDKKQPRRNVAFVISTLLIINAYTIIPQFFAIVFDNSPFYKGVNPVQQTESNQNSLGFVARMSGAIDPTTRIYWNQTLWIFVLLLGMLGISVAKHHRVGTSGARIGFLLFAGLNFSGIFWSVSINRAWTFLPAVGGMLRNPDKIFAIFIIFIFVLSALWLKSHPLLRRLLAVCLVLSSSGLYFSSGLRPATQTAQIELPQSYVDVRELLTRPNTQNRVLLLPIPNWFHHYSWTNGIQTTNLLRVAVDVPVVSDEMNPSQNIPVELVPTVENIYSKDCKAGVASAKFLGVTKIVLQKDLLRVNESEIQQLNLSLRTCFGQPIFTSPELLVFNANGSAGRFYFPGKDDLFGPRTSIQSTILGHKACTTNSNTFVIREKTSNFTYQVFASPFTRVKSSVSDLGWRKWELPSPGCYYIFNFTSLVGVFSLLLSLIALALLFIFRKREIPATLSFWRKQKNE
jgi:hypothetical protein